MTTSASITQKNHTLIGIVVDVSSSMRRNWRNKDGKRLPRIEVIRDALNRRLREEQQLRVAQSAQIDSLEIFCLGMGFQAPMHTNNVDLSNEQEHSLHGEIKTWRQVDLVCDLLALSKILPGKEKLTAFKEKLNEKWSSLTGEILEKSVITEDVAEQLTEYAHAQLYNSAMYRLHQSLLYRLFQRYNKFLLHFEGAYQALQEAITAREKKIISQSREAAEEYVHNIFNRTTKDFHTHRDNYISIIQRHLHAFVQSYIRQVVRALTLGFKPEEMVEDLDQERAIKLAKQIYQELDKEVKKHMTVAVALYRHGLVGAMRSIAASLDMKEVNILTERFVQKIGWDILKPLIEQTVYTMFAQQFEKEAKESFPYWIRLASTREVVQPLDQLSYVLPEVIDEHVYSQDVMFGTTPFKEALDKAAIRLIEHTPLVSNEVLIVVSDGEFEEETKVMVSANLLKRRGVTIISCLVSERNILTRFLKPGMKKLTKGAQLMLDIASPVSQEEAIIVEKSPYLLSENKLCYQINHSSLLEDLLEAIFASYRDPKVQ